MLSDNVSEKSVALMVLIDSFLETNDRESDIVGELADSTASSSVLFIISIGIGALILGAFLAFSITRSITKPINKNLFT